MSGHDRSEAPAPPAERAGGPFQPLRERPYALLFSGQLCSLLGDAVYVVALPFLILDRASARDLGLVLTVFGIARVAVVPLGGFLADRASRVTLMLLADAGRMVCVALLALFAFSGQHSLLPLFALAAALGGLQGLFLPPSFAVLPDVVSPELLPAGNALSSMATSGSALVGPALAGAAVAAFGTGPALAFDAATFLVSAATLFALRSRVRHPTRETAAAAAAGASSTPSDFRQFLLTSRVLQFMLLITLVSNLAIGGMTEITLPVFSRSTLERGAQGFGLMLAAFGAGSLAGGLLAASFFRLRRRGLLALGLGAVEGLTIALVPVAGGLLGASLLLAVTGVAGAVVNVFYLSNLQQRVPGSVLGRSMAAVMLAVLGAQPVAVVIVGTLIGSVGPAPLFVAGGLLVMLAFAIGLLSSQFRNM